MQEEKTEKLKTYLRRLDAGEDLENVRKDFVANFKDVSAEEIMSAEQSLISEGVPVSKVTNLCDIHSALFEGKTCAANENIPAIFLTGHPLNILTRENEEIEKRLDKTERDLASGDAAVITEDVKELTEASRHYDKKDQLLLPVLKRAGVPGPSDVMWDVDGQLRKSAVLLSKQASAGNIDADGIKDLVQRMKEMIHKENSILYPMCEKKFTRPDWQEAAANFPKFGYSYLTNVPLWSEALDMDTVPSVELLDEAHLHLPGGELTLKELAGILKTLPLELTFIDRDNVARYFKDGELFPRPTSELGHDVFDCHPPKARPIVETVLDELRSGKQDSVSFVADKHGRKAYVRYLAVRGQQGEYLGTLEAVEDISEIPTI